MVTVAIGGGLGNQLFQYAAGRALSLRLGTELQLDSLELLDPAPRRHAAKRHYDLPTVFRIDPKFVLPARLFRRVQVPYAPAILGKIYGPLLAKLGHWQYVRQKGFIAFDPAVFSMRGSVYLYGGWQSEKYFIDQADVIRRDLTFRDELTGAAGDLARDIAALKSVALHVRRGDKLWNPVAVRLCVVAPQEYYDAAVALMKKKIGPDIKVFVFSDDIDWCRRNLKVDAEHAFVGSELSGPRGGGHLQLMSLCKHFIMPESTFPWWGAWLSTNKGKVVIAPKRMFQDETIDTKDAYPETWIRI